jgi:hypothetical protein
MTDKAEGPIKRGRQRAVKACCGGHSSPVLPVSGAAA